MRVVQQALDTSAAVLTFCLCVCCVRRYTYDIAPLSIVGDGGVGLFQNIMFFFFSFRRRLSMRVMMILLWC